MEMWQLASGENGSDLQEKDSCPLMPLTFLYSALKIMQESLKYTEQAAACDFQKCITLQFSTDSSGSNI